MSASAPWFADPPLAAALWSGLLTVSVLAAVRLRPDPRLRARALDRPATASRVPRPRRRARVGPGDLAAWCDRLAREVRSGSSLVGALRDVAAPAGAPTEIRHRLDRGVPLAEALEVVAPTVDEQTVLIVLSACASHGGPAAQPLDRVAATLRRRAADAAERAVHSAQARLSARVMTVVPGGVLLLLVATSPSVRGVATTPTGLVLVGIGALLNGLGWWWMRRIIVGSPRPDRRGDRRRDARGGER